MNRRGILAACLPLMVALMVPVAHVAAQQAPPTWPRTSVIDGTTLVVYQPQAIAWPDHTELNARAAIAITPRGESKPILGTVELTLTTQTDAATGLVDLSNPRLTASHFPSLDTAAAAQLEQRIKEKLPALQMQPVPLETVLLSLKDKPVPDNVAVQNDPPVIFYSAKPASLVVFDGEPVLAPAGNSGLSYAVNTNWDVFTDGKAWYLLANGLWLSAPAFDGQYAPVATLPAAFTAIPSDQNFADARKAIPPRPGKPAAVPTIFVSTKPAEIIVTAGAPQFAPVQGTGLQAVSNTASTLFLETSSGRFFLLVSGRWFASQGLGGPWHFASNDLPPDFAAIPPDGKFSPVLASVPGTSQAELAVLRAQVPQQATLKKDTAKLTVAYAGTPQFKPIPGTSLTYAVNTSSAVIETGGRYYVCYQGAWFVGPSPNGPWMLADSVPPAIYTIPPSFPLYNVTYVKVYAATPATVTYGYTAGYMMGYVTAGVVVYGTGYYYPPVVVAGRVPIYYPYPYSYAGNTWYNTSTGAWAQGGAVYGPYGGVAKGGTYYNPSNGAWAQGGAVYGPNGGAGAFSAYNPSTGGYARGSASWSNGSGTANASYYNPRTGVSGSTNQNANAYSRWGSSTFAGPSQTVHTESGSNANGSAGAFSSSSGAQGAGYRTATGNSGGAVKTQNGDVYAGHDGNVYQHGSDGWSKYSDGGWQPVTPPANASQASQNRQTSGTQTTTPTSGRQTASTTSTTAPPPASTTAPKSTATPSKSATTSSSTPTQRNSTTRPPPSQTGTRSGAQGQQAARQPMENSSYQQLEQDRQARFSGGQQGGGWRSGGAEGGHALGGRNRR
jgi:hypothetical protein